MHMAKALRPANGFLVYTAIIQVSRRCSTAMVGVLKELLVLPVAPTTVVGAKQR